MHPPSLAGARPALLFGVLLGLAGCGPAAPDEGAQPPPVVSVSDPIERDVTEYSSFTGRTAAVESVQVRARVWGYLQKVNFTEGAEVRKGDALFEIDPSTYQTMVDQARGRLTVAQAQLNLSEAEAARNTALRAKGVVSREDFEKTAAARETAAASVDSARADLARANLDLDFTKVRAPISGRVSRAMVTVGNLVQSGEIGGTVLTTIVSLDPMWAYFDVDDLTFLRISRMIRAGKMKSGSGGETLVLLGLADEDGYPHRGIIDFMDNQVNAGTGTLQMRGVFPNKDRSLTPGLFARIRVPLGASHRALLVTDRAVDTDQGQKVLYVVGDGDVIDKRPVRLGPLYDGLREVVDGLRPGERVVVDGIQRVHGGIKVEPHPVDMPVFQDARPAPAAPDKQPTAPAGESKKS
jgi:RND family efflux transporter MFP subunit